MKRAMLAPLKDRSILLRADDESTDNEAALRLALRQARQAQRQAAEHGARQSIALTNEVARLGEHNRQLRNRLDELENGQVIVALGQQLMALRAENEALLAAAHRVCSLNQALHATRREGERLARARDDALDCLYDCTIQPVTP